MSSDTLVLEDPYSSHRIYIGDSIGCLRVAQCDPPSSLPSSSSGYSGPTIKPLILPNFKSHSDNAVQRLATGVLSSSSSTYVVAMARKNATIDVVQIMNQSLPSSSASPAAISDLRAEVMCTIRESHMKAGIQRFIGLAVGEEGVYSVTSSGVFRFTPISIAAEGNAEVGEAKVLDYLPAPLQHVSFYPSTNPTHFCYGGEDIPLSLWHIPTAVSEQQESAVGDLSIHSTKTEDLAGLNSKQRKRKRQLEAKTKARELMWGEIWRAKNLPNDNLSLPRRANITSTHILSLDDGSEGGEAGSVGGESFIAVGTKDGLVRIYQPGGSTRKHIREIRVIPAGQGSVKTLSASFLPLDAEKGGLLFVGDTGSKLYTVDWRTGALLYSYKGMGQVGATLSMTTLPLPPSRKEAEALVTVSSDSLVRFCTTVPAAAAVPKAGASAEKGEVMWTKMIANAGTQSVHASPTALVWDGVLPGGLKKRRSNGVKDAEGAEEGGEEDEQEADEIFAKMEEVGGKGARGKKVNGSKKDAEKDANEEEEEDDDDDDDDSDDDEEEAAELMEKSANNSKANSDGKRKGKPALPKKSRK
ncbi:hypothetical protein NDA14_001158 [Ustilago hordei]|uniref:Ribosome biogenesis protein NSA1 n=1 Tax=Ustilago hordei TaxID=120017 RepID=I2G138_USTHO|nr:uncharacterized protein UHO2_03315 [Ustilago hordei]KAJ1599723.1 hypothetical protein NDA14_001158 [Ustilago hordei]CCF52881.1 uncharacterized protein UHOR_04250 [Ustilago hordei]SYW84118.1 uncharacterized protein UHO2_03315 [Ustilago hordei]